METALFGFLMLGGGAASVSAQEGPAAQGVGIRVDTVLVRGNSRIGDAALRGASGLRAGDRVSGSDVQSAIRRLMGTGNFESVAILSRGETAEGVELVIEVVERPFISAYDFKGLKRISAGTVRDTVKLQGGAALDPAVVARTEQMIRDLLAREGVQVLSVDTVLTPVQEPEGAFRLTFDVREGSRLSIADVRFEGNGAFADKDLRGAMSTKPEGFLWFQTGKFDRDTFRKDLSTNLPAFYAEHGYIDFAVVSDTMVVDPETGKAMLVVRVDEGPQYRLGSFEVQGNSHFPTTQLEQMFRSQRRSVLGLPFGINGRRSEGEVFDRVALTAATEKVRQLYRNEGYLYAQVEPIVKRVAGGPEGSPTVDVTWAISERSPFYVDKISIRGNTKTHESVIRDRLYIFPGDVYNEERLIQSYQSLSGLGFFETPLPMPDIVPNPEAGTVDLVFHIKEKATGSFNFGTMLGGQRGGGLSGFLGYTEPNLFGQAKQAELNAEYGWGRNSIRASYTDPAIFGTRNSASVSLYHTGDRYAGFNNGRSTLTGASVRYGSPIPGLRWSRAFLGYSLSSRSYEAVEECNSDSQDIFCLPTSTASTLSLSLTRETKNHPLFPTAGTRQSFTVGQTGGPLGGDGNYQKATSELEWWVPVGQLGGGQPGSRPVRFALGLQARTGAVFGDASLFPLDRFFVGGTRWGESLRGYDEREITPQGVVPRGQPGFPDVSRVGDAFMTVSGELAARITDGISVSVFADAGNVWSDVTEINPTRLFRGAGVGVMLMTPFGPMGIDYAYGFDKIEPGWKFHIKVGGGF